MKTYTHLGYYNEVGDIRELTPLIKEKKFMEVLDYYMKDNGHFYEEEVEYEVKDTSSLQSGSWFVVVRDSRKFVIFYDFNPSHILNDLKDNEDGDDSNAYVDIYLYEKGDDYTLEGVDGNAFAILGYVKEAMINENFSRPEIDSYINDAMSGDYKHLLAVSCDMVEKCNAKAMM